MAEETKAKKVLISEDKLEIIVAILLGVTALLTAWASWIGSLHGGNQATNYATSNNLSAEANSDWNEASQSLMQDMMLWNTYYEAEINYQFAVAEGDEVAAEKYEYMKDVLLQNNCSEALADAIAWAQEEEESTGYVTSPFEKEGFIESYYEEASALLVESQELLEAGQEDNKNGDAFNLVTVIYSLVLFLLGIIGIFKKLPNRYILAIVAAVAFLIATIYMFTLPLPTGFSLSSFFGG